MADQQQDKALRIEDPKAWRALAHPLRLRIIEHMWMRRSVRAKDLAESLDEPANSISFHLRQLARFGYVEPDPDRASTDARERWWRPTNPVGFSIEEDDEDHPDVKALTDLFRQRARDRLEDWFAVARLPDSSWDHPPRTANFNLHLFLTHDERDQFLDELGDVLKKWMQASQDAPDEQTGEREDYAVVCYAAPQWAYDQVQRRRTRQASG